VTTAEAASAYRDAHDIATATASSTGSNSTSSSSGGNSGSAATGTAGGAAQSSAGVVDFKVMNLSVTLPFTLPLSNVQLSQFSMVLREFYDDRVIYM
jgi:hypothetical protein